MQSGPPTRRRPLLAGLASGFASGLAGVGGCLSLLGPGTTRLADVSVSNLDARDHRVVLTITTADDEVVFRREVVVPSADDAVQPVFDHKDGVPTTRDRYTVRARLADDSDAIERTYPTGRRGGDCYSVAVRVWEDGTIRDMPSTSYAEGCVDG